MGILFDGANSFVRSSVLRRSLFGSIVVCGAMFAALASAQEAALRPPQGGEVRALVIGIDA